MSKNDERPNEDNPSTDEHSQVVEECITVNQDFDNEEQDGPEEDEEVIDDVEGENDQKGCMYRCLTRVGCSYVANLPARWPRTCGILLGVILPLLSLIGVAGSFGHFLCMLEAPLEIMSNDDILAARAAVLLRNDFLQNLTLRLPQICANLYFMNLTQDELRDQALDCIEELFIDDIDTTPNACAQANVSFFRNMNVTTFMIFTAECSTQVIDFASNLNLTEYANERVDTALGRVTFDWVRCADANNTNSTAGEQLTSIVDNLLDPFSFVNKLRPGVQERYVTDQWHSQQQELYEKYVELYLVEGVRPIEARNDALVRSFEEASGFDGCTNNVHGATWFWFTVMTTIGYGNTAPHTEGGQAMIYTFGFFSILLFGVVLAQCGTIITAIFDDWVERVHLHWLTIPWIACIFWGCLYYGWMVIIAAYTLSWKQYRVDPDFQFGTAYWFSYVSTTTIGLGDYFLEHSLILPIDLVAFSILFLFGFSILSNFLVKLSELVTQIGGVRGTSLADALRKTNAPCCPPLPAISRKHFSLRSKHKKKNVDGSREFVEQDVAAGTNDDEAANGKVITNGDNDQHGKGDLEGDDEAIRMKTFEDHALEILPDTVASDVPQSDLPFVHNDDGTEAESVSAQRQEMSVDVDGLPSQQSETNSKLLFGEPKWLDSSSIIN